MGSAKKIQQAPEGLYMQPVKTIHNVGQEQRASCLECNETSLFQGINQLSNRKMVPDQPRQAAYIGTPGKACPTCPHHTEKSKRCTSQQGYN